MRNPNGYGSVYKLSGNRRNPWTARITTGWTFDEEEYTSYPIYKFIGYYPTRKEAMLALSEYNKDPYDLSASSVTFAEIYDRWSRLHFDKVSYSNITAYKASYKLCESLYDIRFTDIRLEHMQSVINNSGKNTPTLKKLKIMFGLMYDYAIMNEIVPPDRRTLVKYLDINKAGNPNAYKRTPFKKTEINKVWEFVDKSEYISVILILIYTGLRIGELLDLKKEDINLEERWLYVAKSKTKSGIRYVPIAEKIVPFIEQWMKKDCEYLICTEDNKKMTYSNYLRAYWNTLMESMNIKHMPHDTRHTCISLLKSGKVDDVIIRKIVGHKGHGVTETVYMHLELPDKLEAINKI